MAYVKIEELDMEEQVSMLLKAVRELQERFNAHRHMDDDRVTVDVRYMPTTDLDGKFVEDDD